MPRPRSQTQSIAVRKPEGAKIIFNEDFLDDIEDFGESSTRPTRLWGTGSKENDEEDEEDGDDAPEAVGLGVGKEEELRESQRIIQEEKEFLETIRKRSKRINEIKSQVFKRDKPNSKKRVMVENDLSEGFGSSDGSISEDEEEDEDTKRLKNRMKTAMEAGDDESLNTEDEDGSFKTDSEGDSDSEKLDDLPMDETTQKLHARMQKAMENAEKRAGTKFGKSLSSSTKGINGKHDLSFNIRKNGKSELGSGSATKKSKLATSNESPLGNEESQWDLEPLPISGKPLSASTLRAAAYSDAQARARDRDRGVEMESKRKSTDSTHEMDGRRNKKSKKVFKEIRKVDEKTSVKLLQPYGLPVGGGLSMGLPPVISSRDGGGGGGGGNPVKNFYATAMRYSGLIPGRNIVAGRKKV